MFVHHYDLWRWKPPFRRDLCCLFLVRTSMVSKSEPAPHKITPSKRIHQQKSSNNNNNNNKHQSPKKYRHLQKLLSHPCCSNWRQIKKPLMVNWWFGVGGLGFLGAPYARKCVTSGAPRIPRPPGPKPTNQSNVEWKKMMPDAFGKGDRFLQFNGMFLHVHPGHLSLELFTALRLYTLDVAPLPGFQWPPRLLHF